MKNEYEYRIHLIFPITITQISHIHPSSFSSNIS